MPVTTPDWVKDAVFYQIFPERFAKSDRVPKPSNLEPWDSAPTHRGFKGGDLVGIAERLDYLAALGVNAIYLNPIFQSASNHRYHTHDYYRVDPILGGDDALRTLLDAAHARGMKVVLDGVFNHASRGFFQFNHLLELGEKSPYVDWFLVDEFPLNAYTPGAKPNYAAWWGIADLPKLNTDTPAVRDFIFDVAAYWIRFGADGWRLDVPSEIDDDAFWQEFRRRVKDANPEAYIVGELWEDSRRWLQGDQFDAVMNYLFARPALGFFGAETLPGINHGPYEIEAMDAAEFAQGIEYMIDLYDWEIVQAQLNLLGSHDTARALTMMGEDASALELATLCQMTLPGAPSIYYGDELGLLGGHEPACRNTIPWDRIDDLTGSSIYQTTRDAVALRNAHPVLRRGTYETVLAEGKTAAYKRVLNGTTALVAFNTARDGAAITLPADGMGSAPDVIFGAPESMQANDGAITLALPPRSGVVLLG